MKIKSILPIAILVFLGLPLASYAINYPTLVRVLNYGQDTDGKITFKWQQDYDGCQASGFNCSGGLRLNAISFPSNGGEGFYNVDDNFGDNLVFTNFTTTCNELTVTGRICISHPKGLLNRYNNGYLAFNGGGLLYSDVATYVNGGGSIHTIIGGIFQNTDGVNNNWRQSKVNHVNFGDTELPYVPPAVTRNPVLIVPGLMGTELFNDSEKLWPDTTRMILDPSDSFMDPLQFKNDLTPLQSSQHAQVLNQELTFDYTKNLKKEFTSQGYTENTNLFTFPYDWRYGVSAKNANGKTNSDLLKDKITQILQQTGATKVDVIAHSMGGLIVKKYSMDNPATNNIDKVVFVGVPELGSVKSLKVLLQGDNFDVNFAGFGLSEAEIKKISANMPAAYDLLPTQQYYDAKGSFVKVVQQQNYTSTEKDLNYQDFENYMGVDHGFNQQALVNALNLHTAAFENFDMRTAGVNVYAIDGCKTGTIDNIVETRQNNITKYETIKFKDGDGTVPFASASNLPIDSNHIFYSLLANHGIMLTQEGSRQEIVNLVAGSSLSVKPELITRDFNKCGLNGKVIEKHSPVNILATDQYGNKSGIQADGTAINDIPGASYEALGDQGYLYLPTDDGQTYTIAMQGTGTGTYTIKTDDIVNNDVVKTQVFSNLPVTPNTTGTINLGQTNDSLTVQGQTILPYSTISGNQVNDVLPPATTFTQNKAAVALNATDDNSGVLNISYNLDNHGYQKITGPVVLLTIPDGVHTITYFATDKAGNNEAEKSATFTIDTIAPEATIEFDPILKGLKFSGSEPDVTVATIGDIVTLTDTAGNKTEITLNKNHLLLMSAQIQSIKYNGVTADINKNAMVYGWTLNKNKQIKSLSQYITSRKNYTILAVYDGKKTTLVGKDALGIILKSVSGLKIIKITTNKGDFGWGY